MKFASVGDNAPKFRKQAPKEVENDQGQRDSRKVHVTGFPLDWKNEDLTDYFKKIVCDLME